MQRSRLTILASVLCAVTISAGALAQSDTPPPTPAAPTPTPAAPTPTPAAPPPAAPTPPPAKAAPLAVPATAMVNEVKVVVDDKAKSDGEVRFLFAPDGGEAKEIRVVIQKGMNKQAVCRDMAKELSVGLGDKYKVDQYDDDKVKVSGKNNAKFSLTLAAQTATGLTISMK